MIYVERLFLRGRLGNGIVAVRRLRAAKRLAADYEFSGFLEHVPCCLALNIGGNASKDTDVNKICAADRYLKAARALGPMMYPVVRHFVLDDLTLTDWAKINVLPNNGRTAADACERLCLALDRVDETYRENTEE